MKAEIKLGPKEIKEALTEYIKVKQHKVLDVKFNIDPGYQDRFESCSPSLREAIVTIELD